MLNYCTCQIAALLRNILWIEILVIDCFLLSRVCRLATVCTSTDCSQSSSHRCHYLLFKYLMRGLDNYSQYYSFNIVILELFVWKQMDEERITIVLMSLAIVEYWRYIQVHMGCFEQQYYYTCELHDVRQILNRQRFGALPAWLDQFVTSLLGRFYSESIAYRWRFNICWR